ncbi:hypothetical protein JXB41_08955 [Candidatus Woesearchaeota archaeon]|nr:hypothetical protein [Candidatus Woesearchaeota archaeon]
MDFKVEKRDIGNHHAEYSDNEMDIAYNFSKQLIKEAKGFAKAIVLFGSTARKNISETEKKETKKAGDNENKHDIDLLVIIDDVSLRLSREIMQTYEIIVENIIAKVSKRLHITTLRFSSFWEYVRAGDPVAVNILRDGVPLLDTGFFEPLKVLLYTGRIRPSPESINNYLNRAPRTLHNARWHILQATVDLYWAVVDAAHAALMSINEVPPSPAHVADMLNEKIVKPGLLDKKYVHIMKEFYHINKDITHGGVSLISGEEFDNYFADAEDFVETMKEFILK